MQQKIVLSPIPRVPTQQDLENLVGTAQSSDAVTVGLPFIDDVQHEYLLNISFAFGSGSAPKWYLFDGERTGGSMLWSTSTQHLELVRTKVLELVKNSDRRAAKKAAANANSKYQGELPPPAVFNTTAYNSTLSSITDATTGMFNEGCLFWLLSIEFDRFQRFKHPLSLLLICPPSGFAGPLVEVGQKIRTSIRSIDLACTYAGNFALILPQSDIQEARQCADRLSKLLASSPYIPTGSLQTFSIGIAGIPNHCEHHGVLISAAKQAADFAYLNKKPFLVFGDDLV